MIFKHIKSLRQLWIVLMTFILLAPMTAQGAPLRQEDSGIIPVDAAVLNQLEADGTAEYWVIMKDQADLSAAYQMTDWNARGQYVYDQLISVADKSQKALDPIFNGNANAKHKRYWIVNAIQVKSDQAVLNQFIHHPAVKEILSPFTFKIPDPIPGTNEPQVDGIEWNINRINAPQVWTTYGDTGQGIVVANIDTGVQYNHPALVNQYRGNNGDGTFTHDYNWYDPSKVCGNPSLVPCDNNGHGTHTMGTMVGYDGTINHIGVAPGARFIAAKGCEYNTCSEEALLSSAQWILAPTDLGGLNPRPDLRPQIVNNSWGDTGGNYWYQAMVHAWVASGIFPAFAAGNNGPTCGSANSPGDYAESYAAGAFDINNAIASFSSRGAAITTGLIKPNISAPGSNIRSSSIGPINNYSSKSGTSMASPHVAGTVALMWAEAPYLIGNIQATRDILDQSAIDTEDLQCSGTAANNNVWGQGRLDAFAAVDLAVNSLSGYVRDEFAHPLVNATITILGTSIPAVRTDANGAYRFPSVPAGTYNVLAEYGRCNNPKTRLLALDRDITNFNLILRTRVDSFGYSCQVQTPQYIEANTILELLGDDVSAAIDLPFSFPFYGVNYNSAWVCTNGYVSFLPGECGNNNDAIPSTAIPNAAIYPFWDNLNVDASASVRTQILNGPNRFIIEWRNVFTPGNATKRVDFELILYEDGQILTQYRNIGEDNWEKGNTATLGIENETGTAGFQYSNNEAVITPPAYAIMYKLHPQTFINYLSLINK